MGGRLLIEAKLGWLQKLGRLLGARPAAPVLAGHVLRPLFPTSLHRSPLALRAEAADWWLATPTSPVNLEPWDHAHAAAERLGYLNYVEPDATFRAPLPPPGADPVWPPTDPVSPAWHLEKTFTGFAEVRSMTGGGGVRIAHLDTGYAPGHPSRPRRLREDLAWDFWTGQPGAVDTGRSDAAFPPDTATGRASPGHGTATLALLAGNRLRLASGDKVFDDDFGGAPEAEVAPVRIAPTLIEVTTATMAQGIAYALAPRGDPSSRCDVIAISHGGPPTASWARAINDAYEAGVVVVAAAGDNINVGVSDIATRDITYPAAFQRVIAVTGATYARAPYQTQRLLALQGNFGPQPAMQTAIAAFTPNIAWMDAFGARTFSQTGGGTSAAAPQVAAACALWLSLHGQRLPRDWRRAEACRVALFESVRRTGQMSPDPLLGWGILDVPAFLDAQRAAAVINRILSGAVQKPPPDAVDFSLFRLLFGAPPPGATAERMYEAEVAQLIRASDHKPLLQAAHAAAERQPPPAPPQSLRQALKDHPISDRLRAWIP